MGHSLLEPRNQNRRGRIFCIHPPRSLTCRPWKVTFCPNREGESVPSTIFQGRAVKLRGCNNLAGIGIVIPPSWSYGEAVGVFCLTETFGVATLPQRRICGCNIATYWKTSNLPSEDIIESLKPLWFPEGFWFQTFPPTKIHIWFLERWYLIQPGSYGWVNCFFPPFPKWTIAFQGGKLSWVWSIFLDYFFGWCFKLIFFHGKSTFCSTTWEHIFGTFSKHHGQANPSPQIWRIYFSRES